MSKYTVIVMRPLRMSKALDEDFDPEKEIDAYTAHVDAKNSRAAVIEAQNQVWRADRADLKPSERPEVYVRPSDYRFVVLFGGHQEPLLFSFQSW